MTTRAEHRRHRWADVVAILAGVYALVAAAWFPPEMISGGDSAAVGDESWLWTLYAVAGVLGVGGVFVALRWPAAGKVAVGLGGGVMLAGFLTLQEFTALAALSIGVTGLVMLAASPFVGRMPTPEEEGKARDPDPDRTELLESEDPSSKG